MLDLFPTKYFQKESDYKPLWDILNLLKRRDQSEKRGFKLKDLETEASQGVSCNQLLVFFLLKLSSLCNHDEASSEFLQETAIMLVLIRKFLNEKGYIFLSGEESSFGPKSNTASEFCSNKNNNISVLMVDGALGSFFYEFYPCYLSNVLR